MIKKFENYINNDLNKVAIDSASVIESTTPDGDVYKHTLEFVLPYHENKVIDTKKYYKGAYDFIDYTLKFTKFENDIGGLGRGLVQREIITSGFVYEGIFYRNDRNARLGGGPFDQGSYWAKSKKENKPLYVLKFVSSKNGVKRYSEEGLETVKQMYPDLVYKK
jgi:hypothetical protein